MATADVSPYGNPATAEQGVQPAGMNTPATAGLPGQQAVFGDVPEDEGKLLKPLPLGWPRGKKSFPAQHSGQIVEPAPQHTPEQDAALEAHYEALKPGATNAAREYVLARTPAQWQADMVDLIEEDWPVPEAPEPPAPAPPPIGGTGNLGGLAPGGPGGPVGGFDPNLNPNTNPNATYPPQPAQTL